MSYQQSKETSIATLLVVQGVIVSTDLVKHNTTRSLIKKTPDDWNSKRKKEISWSNWLALLSRIQVRLRLVAIKHI